MAGIITAAMAAVQIGRSRCRVIQLIAAGKIKARRICMGTKGVQLWSIDPKSLAKYAHPKRGRPYVVRKKKLGRPAKPVGVSGGLSFARYGESA